jgi:hypothetical protein
MEKKSEGNQEVSLTDAYSLFVYAIRTQITRDYYLRRLRTFFDFIKLLPNANIDHRCNSFAALANKDNEWTFNKIICFLQFQKERVQRKEITAATLYNFVKALKLFCEMSDVPVSWKKITRGLPKVRSFANDRAPTIEEVRKMIEYPDRRMKAIIFTMASSGIRLGAWDYLRWKDIEPIMKEDRIVAAKVTVYAGEEDQYFSFITPESFYELERWISYRKEAGEVMHKNTWVMRQLWNTKEGYYHGIATEPTKLKSSGIKRLIERSLWTQGIRKKSETKKNRYEFQTDHGFRKWFKTRCEIAGMRSINIEKLMGHSVGISDSYYRATESELLDDYLKATDLLTISEENSLKKKVESLQIEKSRIEQLESTIKKLEQRYYGKR